MTPPTQDEWLREAESFHEQTQEMYKKDKKMQEDLRFEFTRNPDGLRRRLDDIEAQALGLQYNEMNILEDEKGKTASESKIKQVEKNVEEAMLKSNPLFFEQELQYRDGLIYPVDWKQKKADAKKAKTRGS